MDYGDVSGGDSDAAVRAIVAQLQGVPSQAAANPSDPAPAPAIMPVSGVTPAMTAMLPQSAPAPAAADPGAAWPNGWRSMGVGDYAMPQMGTPATWAANSPNPKALAPALATSNPQAALMGALVAPRPTKPTMGTVYNPQPIVSNTQGLAAIAQGISAGLDGRDDLKKKDALQDAIQDATEPE